MSEPDFMNALVARTGCGLLLDLNNVHVTCTNLGHDTRAYLKAIDLAAAGEIHLAGHSVQQRGNDPVLIDTHSDHVCEAVWALYADAIARIGNCPTLIEWDQDIPELPVLLAEAERAQDMMTRQVADVA
jgi:uncharacterized protein (UPF0276 family)